MRKIVFTELDGYPLEQDTLEFMQDGYHELILALAQPAEAYPANTPIKISGMAVVGTIHDHGWFYYNGELIKFTGVDTAGLSACGGGQVLGIIISEAVGQLEFEDLSMRDVWLTKTAAIGCGVNALTADFIPLTTAFKTYAEYLGRTGKEVAETHLVVSMPGQGLAGDIYYRKDVLTNSLHIRGTLTLTTASTPATPTYLLMDTLAAAYRPASQVVSFPAFQRYHGGVVMDSTSTFPIIQLNCELKTNGDLAIGAIKAVTVGSYSVNINAIVPLD